MLEPEFIPTEFNLDDKELINEFTKANMSSDRIKDFAYILLKARFYLDNYIVHHSKEEDTLDSNPCMYLTILTIKYGNCIIRWCVEKNIRKGIENAMSFSVV